MASTTLGVVPPTVRGDGKATTSRLRQLTPLSQRPGPSRRNLVLMQSALASLARAVGIKRMGGEDAHADQGEDSC
jgi:hypothetical protein